MPRASPAATASSAAMEPSVETIGATSPTLPRLSAEYTSSNPTTLLAPAKNIHPRSDPPSCPGRGPTAIAARLAARPMSITHARTDAGPIIRLERDEHSVPVAHMSAVPSPARTAIMPTY